MSGGGCVRSNLSAYVIGDVTVKNVAVEIGIVVAKLRDRRWTGAVASSVHCGAVWCRGGGSVLDFEVVRAVVHVWGTGRVWIIW